ncbi:hypothetical protein FQN54_006012 [Arachnomyces sp. PD_36]|nr:hypothetical protein FQN54_006012 [Arachnomyces sp. PD_36]
MDSITNRRFSSGDELKNAVRAIAIQQRWELGIKRSETTRIILMCRSSPDCPFRIKARNYDPIGWRVTSGHFQHTCLRNVKVGRGSVSHLSFLLGEAPKVLDMSKNPKPKDLVDAIQDKYGATIHIRQAQKAMRTLKQQNGTQSSRGDTHVFPFFNGLDQESGIGQRARLQLGHQLGQNSGPSDDSTLPMEPGNDIDDQAINSLTPIDLVFSRDEFNIFILCTYCIRMIMIESSTSGSDPSTMPSPASPFSLFATTCRACNRRQDQSVSSANAPQRLSVDIIRNTRVYDCACKIAGVDDVEVPSGSDTASYVSVKDLADKLTTNCRIYGICTVDSTLRRIHELGKESLMLPYLPGGFL